MFNSILLLWIGYQLNAPTPFFVLAWVSIICSAIGFWSELRKASSKSIDDK